MNRFFHIAMIEFLTGRFISRPCNLLLQKTRKGLTNGIAVSTQKYRRSWLTSLMVMGLMILVGVKGWGQNMVRIAKRIRFLQTYRGKAIIILSLLNLILINNQLYSQCGPFQVYESFGNTTIPTQGGTWSATSMTYGNTSSTRSGQYGLTFNAAGDIIRTPLIVNPGVFSFWYKRSSNSTSWSCEIETSPDGLVWTSRGTINSITVSFQQYSINLGVLGLTNIYVRVRDTRASGTHERYIDDMSWTSTTPSDNTILIQGASCSPSIICGVNYKVYDVGGVNDQYNISMSSAPMVLTPSSPGGVVTASFSSLATESGEDFVRLYDGNLTSLAQFSGSPFSGTTTPSGTFVSNHSTGAITLNFTSDISAVDDGFAINVSCILPCSGAPTGGLTQSSTNSVCGPYNSTLSVSGSTTNVSGLTYQWESSTDGGVTWINAAGTSTNETYNATNISVNTRFRRKITCGTSTSSDYSSVVSLSVPCYNMPSVNTTVATCSGDFYDSGGSSGSYGNNETRLITFTPSNLNAKIRVSFTSFDTELGYDGLMIYNGNSPTSPFFSSGSTFGRATCPNGAWSGSTIPPVITSTAADGSITFRFTSNISTIGAGWAATISCVLPCSGTPNIPTISPSSSTICSGSSTPVNLTASGVSTDIGISYLWESSSNGTTYTSTGNTSTNYAPPATLGTTYYQLKTTCSTNGNVFTSTSNPVPITGVNCSNVINIPGSGSNTIVNCGTNTILYDPGGPSSNYQNNANGYVVFKNGGNAKIRIVGNYNLESFNGDIIQIYSGEGISSAPIKSFSATSGIIDILGGSGESITVRFKSDASSNDAGFMMEVTYDGSCDCAGTPAIPTITASATSICAGSQVTLSSSGSSTGTGISYQWESSSNSSSGFTSVIGETATDYTPIVSSGVMFYRLKTTCANGGATSTSSPVAITGLDCVPLSGSSIITCGTNTTIYDHAGPSANYSNNADGFIILKNGGGTSGKTITINGNYTLESGGNFDYIYVYSGEGITPTLKGTFTNGSGSINIIGSPGETITIRFKSDFSNNFAGFVLNITYSTDGICSCSGIPDVPVNSFFNTNVCQNTSIPLSVKGLSSGAGISYQWETSTNGIDFISATGTGSTSSSFTPTISSIGKIYYRIKTTCSSTDLSSYSDTFAINSINCGTDNIPNDVCGKALNLSINANPTTGTIFGSTQGAGACTGSVNFDVWYKFTTESSCSGSYTVFLDPGKDFDGVFQLYSDCSNTASAIGGTSIVATSSDAGTFTNNGCIDFYDSKPEDQPDWAIYNLAPNTTYYLRIYDFNQTGTDLPTDPSFTISVSSEFNSNAVKVNAGPDQTLCSLSVTLSGSINGTADCSQHVGTANNDTYLYGPFSTGSRRSRKQYLYTQSILNAAGVVPGNLTSIGFYVKKFFSNQVMNNFVVKLKNTSTTSLVRSYETVATTVFSGTFSVNSSGLNVINFNTPFNWTGSNLLVEIEFNNSQFTKDNSILVQSVEYTGMIGDYTLSSGSSSLTSVTFDELYIPVVKIGQLCNTVYSWDGPGGFSSNSLTPTVTSTGTYTLSATIQRTPLLCPLVSDEVTISACPPPAPFSECNLVVYKVGDGTSLSSDAFPVKIEEVRTDGQIVQTLGSNLFSGSNLITQAGDKLFVGYLNSNNGFLAVPGYSSSIGTVNVVNTDTKFTQILQSNPTNRTTVSHNGQGTFSGGSYRSVIPVSNDRFYAIGNDNQNDGEIWYYNGSTFTKVFDTTIAIRNIEIFNGSLYYSSGTGTTNGAGIYKVGETPLPTLLTYSKQIISTGTNPAVSPYGFSFSPDGLILYIADDVKGIQKWVKSSGGSWTLSYTFSSIKSRGLVVDYSRSKPEIYATTSNTSDNDNSIVKVVDNGNVSSSVVTTLRSAGPNYVYRGIDFTPNSYFSISSQPNDVVVCQNTTPAPELSVSISPVNSSVSYQWYKATSATSYAGASIPTTGSGASTNKYTPDISTAGTSYYFVKISNCANVVNSNIVAVTVNAAATVTATASNLNPCTGETVTLNGSFGGSATSGNWAPPSVGSISTSGTTTTYTAPSTAGTVTLSYTSDDPDDTGPCLAATKDVVLTVANCSSCPTIWGNIQSPGSGTICEGGTFNVYGQVYIASTAVITGTDLTTSSLNPKISVQLGLSSINSDPSTWPASAWRNTTFNSSPLNPSDNDEYFTTLSGLSPGNYYYAFRYSYDGCTYVYGGYNSASAAWPKPDPAWNRWTINSGGFGNDVFIGTSTNNGGGSAGIDSDRKAFGLINSTSSSNTTEAIRNFPALPVGQTIQFDMDNGFVNSGGAVGVSLQNSSGDNVWEFFFSGGSSSYTINAGSVPPTFSIPFTVNGLRISFTLTSSTTYSVTIQVLNGGITYGPFTGSLFTPASGQSITKFRAFNFKAGNDPSSYVFINKLIGPNINDNASFYSGGILSDGIVAPNPAVGGIWNGTTPSPTTNTSGILVVDPIPNTTVQPSPLCSGSDVTVSSTGASTYEFFLNGVSQGNSSSASSKTFSPLNRGQQVCVRGYPTGGLLMNGEITEPFWGNPIVTSAGGPTSGFGNNRINALYINNGLGYLNLAIAGRLENDNVILLFLDTKPGGFNTLSSSWIRSNAPTNGLENLNGGIQFDLGFEPDYVVSINVSSGTTYLNFYNMTNNTNTYLGTNPNNLISYQPNNNSNDLYTKGYEIRIPLSLIGNLSSPIKVFSMLTNNPNSGGTTLSNQFLSPAGATQSNYGTDIAVNFNNEPPNPISFTPFNTCMVERCISVDSTPIVRVNNAAICPNALTTITAIPDSGIVSNYNYKWDPVPSVFSDPGNVNQFNTSVGGDYVVKITNKITGCESAAATANISVIDNSATLALQPDPLCSGSDVKIKATGGVNYEFFLQRPPATTRTSQGAFALPRDSVVIPALNANDKVCVSGISAITLDGIITEPFWGSPVATSAGGATSSDGNNRIDALYVNNQFGYLSLAIAGNLKKSSSSLSDQKILLFIDSKPSSGCNKLDNACWNNRSNSPNFSVRNLNNGIEFDNGFFPDFILCIGSNPAGDNFFFDLYDIKNNKNVYLGSTLANPSSFAFSPNAPSEYNKGFEFRISKTFFGEFSSTMQFFAMVVNTPVDNSGTIVSNQFLTRANSGEGSFGSGAINFKTANPNPVSYTRTAECYTEACKIVQQTPSVQIENICLGNTTPSIQTTTNSDNGFTYTAYSLAQTAGATPVSLTPSNPKTGDGTNKLNWSVTVGPKYYVTVRNSDGCESKSNEVIPTSIKTSPIFRKTP